MRRNKFVNVYVIVLTVITIMAILIGVYRIFGNGTLSFFLPKSTISESISLEAFNSINLNTDVCDLTLQQGNEYSISYELKAHKAELYLPEISVNDGTLTVATKKQSSKKFFNNSMLSCNIIITVPADKNLDSIIIKTSVGDFNVSDITCDSFSINSNVGDIDADKISVNSLVINTDVGDVQIKDSTIDIITITSNVGDINIEDTICNSITGDCNVGDFNLSNVKDKSGNKPKIDIDLDLGDKNIED